ncbi:hypothetical protein D3P08_18350 [Paenibacillus nanensis]|uniref:Uncharacterized protein n=1 Tax=Paenibacillus nanensis TaxID=393251 RepID=A0A3A1US15_9BACL|nr:hypothetical protein D3P08_18350 [Paenibacillus nanensis]
MVSGGDLYEKSYKRERTSGARGSFVRKIVQKRANEWCMAEICTKNRTKGGEDAVHGGDLYEKSYKRERERGERRRFVRKIVQKGARTRCMAEICTKSRTKGSVNVVSGGDLYEKSYKEARGRGAWRRFVRKIVQKGARTW